MNFSVPALISAEHQVEDFDCGREFLNQYLKRFALTNTAAGAARTYVTTIQGGLSVVGYYSLAAGSVEKASVPERIGKGIAQHPVPVVLLARLAADRSVQGQGLGKALLRTLSAASVIGIRAVMVHAKDEDARNFYLKFGFVPSPVDPLLLVLLIKDITRSASEVP